MEEDGLPLETIIAALLQTLGYDPDDPDNPHMAQTPMRVADTFRELTYETKFNFTTFKNTDIDQMIVVDNIPFYSLCAHHLLPFHGKAHIGYLPDKRLVGLSKLARTVDHFSRGFNIQEELTKDISDFLLENLEPLGLAVVIRAHHLCMAMRGIQKPGHLTTTSAMTGAFLDNTKQARQEFLDFIREGRNSGL